ncbi:Polysaccharide deacetylase [uncultured Gammaproteobacteria bacterium]
MTTPTFPPSPDLSQTPAIPPVSKLDRTPEIGLPLELGLGPKITPVVLSDEDEGAWRALGAELDAWGTSGATATLWWRNDQAFDVVPTLRRVRELSENLAIPLALSVIPATATKDLAWWVGNWRHVTVFQHGFAHVNQAVAGDRSGELVANRPLEEVMAEIKQGAERLRSLFGKQFLAVLVPPWNRIGVGVVAALPGLGIVGLSGFRTIKTVPAGIVEVCTHVDPINPRGGEFIGTRRTIEDLTAHLRARRLGVEVAHQPTGLLTCDQALNEPAWAFVERLLTVTKSHPAARWLSAGEVFGGGA